MKGSSYEKYIRLQAKTAIEKLRLRATSRATEIERLLAQPPEGMKDCTITFKECDKGHGWLTATNWVQHACPYCKMERLLAALKASNHHLATLVNGADDENPQTWEDAKNQVLATMELLRTWPEQ